MSHDYDIDIRSIEPEYEHTIDQQAGREVDDGMEVHLSTVTVDVNVSYGRRGERDVSCYSIVFSVDHDTNSIRTKSVGDAHSKRQSFDIARLTLGTEFAERALVAFLEDVGLEDYHVHTAKDDHTSASHLADTPTVHTELEVTADD